MQHYIIFTGWLPLIAVGHI